MVPWIGTLGDAFDNALAETTIGLSEHECTRADSPLRRGPLQLLELEMMTADWVHWYNTSRLMHPGRFSPGSRGRPDPLALTGHRNSAGCR